MTNTTFITMAGQIGSINPNTITVTTAGPTLSGNLNYASGATFTASPSSYEKIDTLEKEVAYLSDRVKILEQMVREESECKYNAWQRIVELTQNSNS